MSAVEVMQMRTHHAPLGDLVARYIERSALTQEAAVEQICRLDGTYISRSTLQRVIAGEPCAAATARILAQWLPYAEVEVIEAWRRQRGT